MDLEIHKTYIQMNGIDFIMMNVKFLHAILPSKRLLKVFVYFVNLISTSTSFYHIFSSGFSYVFLFCLFSHPLSNIISMNFDWKLFPLNNIILILEVVHRLLNSLTYSLQSSGVDLSQAVISVQLDIRKRTNGGSSSAVYDIEVHSFSFLISVSFFANISYLLCQAISHEVELEKY